MESGTTLRAWALVAIALLAGGSSAGRAPQAPAGAGARGNQQQATRNGSEKAKARAVECGLVAPDVKAPLLVFSPEYYRSRQPSCLADRMAFYKVPGVTMAVFDREGLAWSRSFGVLEAGATRPVTAQSVFEAASATKVLTTVMTLRLVERGVLDLDRHVNMYLKSWKVPASPLTAQAVTLRLLLTHRAGINRPDKGLPFDDERPPTLRQVLAGEAPAINQGVVVEWAPGLGHSYSNIGFLIVQLVLEETTGKTYEQLARELVFAPLGLEASTVHHPLTPEWRSRWGIPHDESGVSHARKLMSGAVAHGGLVTSATDLAHLALEVALAYQGRSTRFLSKRSAELMMTKVADLNPREFGAPVGQGLGVMLLGQGPDIHFLHPGGNDPGANCWVIASPVTGKGAVIMTNAAAGEALMLEILASIAHHYAWPDLARQ